MLIAQAILTHKFSFFPSLQNQTGTWMSTSKLAARFQTNLRCAVAAEAESRNEFTISVLL